MAKKNPSPAKLRELVMQALYQKEISGSSNTDLIKQFKQTNRNFNLKGFENCLREIKKDILEHLWKIIISDNSVDQYESNLMRRICGLIYVPDKCAL